jgi:hypothetical protein
LVARTIAKAQRAQRLAVDVALTATVTEAVRGAKKADNPTRERPLNRQELAVLLALFAEVTMHDHLTDTVANKQLLQRLGVDVRDETTSIYKNALRELRRAIDNLVAAGVVTRIAGSGHRASTYVFVDPDGEGGSVPLSEGGTGRIGRGVQARSGEGFRTPTSVVSSVDPSGTNFAGASQHVEHEELPDGTVRILRSAS